MKTSDIWRGAFRISKKSVFSGNLLKHGWKKNLGKLFQPINSPSRLAEFKTFFEVLLPILKIKPDASILDISSPKIFSLLLAEMCESSFLLIDPYEPAIVESQVLSKSALTSDVQNRLTFKVAPLNDQLRSVTGTKFDVVYSMSVFEHITPPETGDRDAFKQTLSLLKPKGWFIVSIPIDIDFEYVRVKGSIYGSAPDEDGQSFFQRCYDAEHIQTLVTDFEGYLTLEQAVVIEWPKSKVFHSFLRSQKLNEVRGLSGPLFPFLAKAFKINSAKTIPKKFTGPGDIVLVFRSRN